jgi:hypothetical protein
VSSEKARADAHVTQWLFLQSWSRVARLMAAVLPEVEQLAEAVEAASALEEVVAHELGCAGSRLDVDAQADGQEGLELFGELVGLLEAGCAVGRDEVQCLQRLLVQVRWLGFDHFNRHDTKGPDIDLVAVFFLLDNLGRHPVRCADHSSTLGSLLCKLGAESEIG